MLKCKLRVQSVLLLVVSVMGVFESKSAVEQLIESFSCKKNTLKVVINHDFKGKYLKEDFFVSYDEALNLEAMPSEIVLMSALCNLITLVWISGKEYSIESMDEDLYYSFKTIKKLFQLSYPETSWDGELIPKKLVKLSERFSPPQGQRPRRALLFSGGLDSTSAFLSHRNEELLLITAWGQYDTPLKAKEAWESRKKRVIEAAVQYGHKNAFIKSNYARFFNWKVVNALSPEIGSWRIAAVDGIGWAGLVAPILLANNCSGLYIASSNSWYYPYIDCINPFFDSSMRFGHYHLIHDQFDYTRMDKAVFVGRTCKENGLKKPYIKVCQRTKMHGDENCCRCKKCLLTILSLCVGGADHREYGFSATLQEAVERTLELLSRKPNEHETLWHFIDIQCALQSQGTQKYYKKTNRAALIPFLKLDLTKMKVSDRKFTVHSKIDWNELAKIVPSVVVPPDLPDPKREVERKGCILLEE